MDTEDIELTEQQAPLLARSVMYGFFSTAFGEPHHERFQQISDPRYQQRVVMSYQLLKGESQNVAPSGDDELLTTEVDLKRLLSEWDEESARHEYRDIFGLTMSEDCPPHEVEYCEKTDLFYRSQMMADVGAFYSAFGLEINDEAPERIDHVRLELEFMQFLLRKQIHGETNHHPSEDLETIWEATVDFFEEHVGWWVPAFGQAVEEEPSADTYADLGRLLRWFVTQERLNMELPVFDGRPEPNVPDSEPKGSCFECSVSDQPQPAKTQG